MKRVTGSMTVLGERVGVVGDDLDHRGGLSGIVGRDGDLLQAVRGAVDGVPVHLDDLLALAAVGLLDGLLDQGDGLRLGEDARDLEEAGLHDRVDAEAQAELAGDLDGVDVVDLDLLVDDRPLHVLGQVLEDLGGLPVGVDQERAALADAFQDVEAPDVGRLVEGDEVDGVEEVLGLDGLLAEAEVGDRDAAGLLGVVLEVALAVHVGVVGDDLDGVLVGADRAVRAVAPELAADRAGGARCPGPGRPGSRGG